MVVESMAKMHKLRDPVHNFVHLREKEIELIDTPVFQRLRGIRQLAMANLVYPGALHTRFDHSIGVCHVAGLMAEELGIADDDLELVRFAALLHDLGHGPFSHVSETSLKRFTDPSNLPAGQKKEKIHELVTAKVILYFP
jgi:putative nucleotidyltransferase with HDIG domain